MKNYGHKLNETVNIRYRNYRGETAVRSVQILGMFYGHTEHHPAWQWFLKVFDYDRNAFRDFALMDCDFLSCEEKPEIITGEGVLMQEAPDGAREDRPTVKFSSANFFREGRAPTYETADAVGADLRACINQSVTIAPGGRATIPTGIRVAIPRGFEGQVRSRSGLAHRDGVFVLNAPGTIDPDYRGEICVILCNMGEQSITINSGDRIAQLVIAPAVQVEFDKVLVSELDETERGEGGFGSTGMR